MEQIASFGEWLRQRRRALDLTQAELARRVGCATGTIKKIEGDARRPSREIAALLATHLQIAVEERDDFIRSARAELAPDRLPPPSRSSARAATPVRPQPRPPRTSNLPATLSSFLGRERELADLRALLSRPGVRLVTLTGAGGTGKTRLALALAAELTLTSWPPLPSRRERGPGGEGQPFPDGVFFVDLAPISDPELVVTAIAKALEITATSERPIEQLKAALRQQHLLLLLDNFEQLLPAAPLVAELLRAAPKLNVLITSRVSLRLSGEHEYDVPPLGLPPAAVERLEGLKVEMFNLEITQYAAIQLFVERARAARASFTLTEANAPAVAEICRRLDGLPLAIELAAARIKLFTPDALLARLGTPLALLTGGARDLPARQQTIRSTLDWSYNLLSADEQRLFRRLGVFVGGFTLEAAEAVKMLNVQTFERSNVLDELASLIDQSLVVVLEPVEGEPRYRMLETLREFALERLREMGEETDARRRHAAYFAAWVDQARHSLRGDAMFTSERLGRELGNLRAVLEWSLARRAEDAVYGLRLFGGLYELWFLRYPSEGGAIAERALACVSAAPQDLVAARIYNAAARLQKNPRRSKQGIGLLERSLTLARQNDDRLLQAEVLRHLGEATRADDLLAAKSFFEQSLHISRELNDAEQEGWTTFNLGIIALWRGDLAAVERWFQHSLAIFVRLDCTFAQAMVLRRIAMFVAQRGDNAAADRYLARALPLVERLGLDVGFSPLIDRGQLACQRGDYQRALELLRQGYDQIVQIDNYLEMVALMWQAVCHFHLGALFAATECCRPALAIALENVEDIRVSQIVMIVANIAVAREAHDTAARLLGSVDAHLASISYTFEHDEESEWKRLHDRALAACRVALSDAAFQAAWTAGQALTLELAVKEALDR